MLSVGLVGTKFTLELFLLLMLLNIMPLEILPEFKLLSTRQAVETMARLEMCTPGIKDTY